ncbi:hypothetical protein FACS18949_15010 [Clostridia bacterium]|nr:hypothetical protein FACS189425_01020 [Clostridia bacterium]GHV36052.1 hypothetical protein FACS18949_15010 [Clostridia bacterium]
MNEQENPCGCRRAVRTDEHCHNGTVDYSFVQRADATPIEGTYKVTCSDEGSISDNG